MELINCLACRSVIQFQYGEDGIDTTSASFLREFGFLARNAARFSQRLALGDAMAALQTTGMARMEKRARKASRCCSDDRADVGSSSWEMSILKC